MKLVRLVFPFLLLILLFVFSVLIFSTSSFSQDNLQIKVKLPSPKAAIPAFAADQIIVKFKTTASKSAIAQLKSQQRAVQIRASKFGRFVILSLPEGSNVSKKAEIFNRNPLVEYAHPNFSIQTNFVPNDPFYCLQWHLDDSFEWDPTNDTCVTSAGNPFGNTNGGGIAMEQAWDISTGKASVVVAVLDTGVAYEDFSDPNPAGCYNRFGELKKCTGPRIDEYFQAPDLANTNFSILPGSDLVNNDDHPNDDNSHGTHVTGTIAQSTNNSLGVAGVAFNTTIMPVKVLDGNGSGLFDVIADAIYFATDNGANVINMSLGSESDAQVLEDAVAYAFANGVFVVTSAGNDFNTGNDIQYPAAYDDYVIAIGATRYDETRAPYSSTGSYVDVSTPGGDTSVDQNNDGFADGVLQQTFEDNSDTSDFSYWFFQGTSMAAPHVAGLAALILSVDGSLSPTEVRTVIESTSEDKGTVGRDDEYGFGIIDAYSALSSLVPSVSISLTTDGLVEFGVLALGATADTSGDIQTVEVTTGPADLSVKSTVFSDGSNIWTLGTSNGTDQVKWEFSKDGSVWGIFSSANTLFGFDTDIAAGSTRDLYLRLTMPTATGSNDEHESTVTITATQP